MLARDRKKKATHWLLMQKRERREQRGLGMTFSLLFLLSTPEECRSLSCYVRTTRTLLAWFPQSKQYQRFRMPSFERVPYLLLWYLLASSGYLWWNLSVTFEDCKFSSPQVVQKWLRKPVLPIQHLSSAFIQWRLLLWASLVLFDWLGILPPRVVSPSHLCVSILEPSESPLPARRSQGASMLELNSFAFWWPCYLFQIWMHHLA